MMSKALQVYSSMMSREFEKMDNENLEKPFDFTYEVSFSVPSLSGEVAIV